MPLPIPAREFRVAVLVASLVALPALIPAHAADFGKTLHVALQIAETSFDPAFASDAASGEIIANVKTKLAGYKAPKRVVFVAQVPRAPNAKADYKAAKQLALDATTPTP